MPTEIEAKIRCPDHPAMRAHLERAGAVYLKKVMETNIFFDRAHDPLLAGDKGLRLRINHNLDDDSQTFIITYKGPRRPGPLKTREEIELHVNDSQSAQAMLERLGFTPTLTFAKKRETWTLADCTVELDELPHLGTFLEVEGPDESAVNRVLQSLDLQNEEKIQPGYSAMLVKWLQETGSTSRTVEFE